MADNYLGNRMDDYRAGKLSKSAPRRLTPSGAKPGTLALPADPSQTIWISEGALSDAGIELIRLLTAAGIRTLYRATDGKQGAAPAIKFGAGHYPPAAKTPEADTEVKILNDEIIIDSRQTSITFQPNQSLNAARIAAALLASPPLSANITL